MDRTPIQYEPISRWRITLQAVSKVVLYILTIVVIAGPTLIMIVTGAK